MFKRSKSEVLVDDETSEGEEDAPWHRERADKVSSRTDGVNQTKTYLANRSTSTSITLRERRFKLSLLAVFSLLGCMKPMYECLFRYHKLTSGLYIYVVLRIRYLNQPFVVFGLIARGSLLGSRRYGHAP